MCVCVYVCVCVPACVCMPACVHTCMCVCMYRLQLLEFKSFSHSITNLINNFVVVVVFFHLSLKSIFVIFM